MGHQETPVTAKAREYSQQIELLAQASLFGQSHYLPLKPLKLQSVSTEARILQLL
jgi:hypothetical protein